MVLWIQSTYAGHPIRLYSELCCNTCASVHDIRAVDDLLENCSQPYVLADLAYLSYELREQLKQKGYHLWTPLLQNMARAKQHNQSLETNGYETDY